MTKSKLNLLDFNFASLCDLCADLGEKKFRAQQLIQWIHQQGVQDFGQMTNLSKAFQQKLASLAVVQPPTVYSEHISADGTYKWLLKLTCGNCIETVFIPETTRGTLCISSQVGCALNCSFCATGKQGFNRNLTVAEIIGQLWFAVRRLSTKDGSHDRKITNVVMMGMGEPLLNFDNVVQALDIMLDDLAYGLSKKRITLSTSGVLPELEKLKQRSQVSLAVSLHAPNNELRNDLVPINKKYPLEQLMALCKNYFQDPKRKVTFEYVMLARVNDQAEHAMQLAKLLTNVPAKVNLIPFNSFQFTQYKCSNWNDILQFQSFLRSKGINTIIRKTRGDDIDAACGQLAGDFRDKTQRSLKWHKLNSQVI